MHRNWELKKNFSTLLKSLPCTCQNRYFITVTTEFQLLIEERFGGYALEYGSINKPEIIANNTINVEIKFSKKKLHGRNEYTAYYTIFIR